jgi:hypothetical protein
MREGNFEVSLVVGSKIVEEEMIDGKMYAYSEPGQEYHVNIAVFRDRRTGQFPAKFLRFGLYVDGIDVQYWKRLDLSQESELPTDPSVPLCVKFWGFKQNISELKSFVFTSPSILDENASVSTATVQNQMGNIKVVIFEAKVTNGQFDNQQMAKQINTSTSVSVENVKLQNQTSMVTSTGNTVSHERESFIPLQRWGNVSTIPLQTITLCYHSRSMIEILSRLTAIQSSSIQNRKRSLSTSEGDDSSSAKSPRIETIDDLDPPENSSTVLESSLYDGDIEVLKKARVVPLLDLSDEGNDPIWSSKEVS